MPVIVRMFYLRSSSFQILIMMNKDLLTINLLKVRNLKRTYVSLRLDV